MSNKNLKLLVEGKVEFFEDYDGCIKTLFIGNKEWIGIKYLMKDYKDKVIKIYVEEE